METAVLLCSSLESEELDTHLGRFKNISEARKAMLLFFKHTAEKMLRSSGGSASVSTLDPESEEFRKTLEASHIRFALEPMLAEIFSDSFSVTYRIFRLWEQ